MPSITEETMEIPDQLVNELRTRFLAQSSTNHDMFDQKDMDQIRNTDFILRRYLQDKSGCVEESLKSLINAMKWRKTFGTNDLNESSFPAEYYQMGSLFTYGQTINAAQMIIFRVKVNKKISRWTDLLKKFIVFLVEKENTKFENNESKGVCVVFDCNGAGITNVDIDLLSFVVSTFRDYYPGLLQSVIINELPWILNYVFKLVQTWLPKEQQKKLQLATHKDINEYIAPEELPDFMGGTNQMSYKDCPKSAPTAQELSVKLGISQKDTDKLVNHLQQYLH